MKQEASIKTAVRIILLYLFVLILGTASCAVIYTVYSLCKNMIAGGGLKVFNLNYFLNGVNMFEPLVVIASGVVMCMYLIRYSIRKVLPFNVFVIAYIAAWAFLVPLNFTLLSNLSTKANQPPEAKHPLTTDYFRTGKTGSIFYYSSIENENLADGICINEEGETAYTFSDVAIPENKGYSDSLIHKSIGMPKLIDIIASWVKMFLSIARQAWESGLFSWICFASIGLALASVAGLCFVSKWRMVNVVSVCTATLGILVLNIMAYTNSFLDPAKVFLEGAMTNVPIKNPLVVLMNVLVFVVFSILGFIVHRKRRQEDRLNDMPYGKEYA